MASNDENGFDLIQPSLIQQLRKILDEYPDDGQILKELIQNAEDAGATHVKFLHDKNSYGTAKLFDDCEELAENQGPALYAHNNALFTTEDWKGIRLVSDSIKVEDPMKVGRFGLGFKSVFHMTAWCSEKNCKFPGVRLQQLHCAWQCELGIILNNPNPSFTWAF